MNWKKRHKLAVAHIRHWKGTRMAAGIVFALEELKGQIEFALLDPWPYS
jgi:hypothetical protein